MNIVKTIKPNNTDEKKNACRSASRYPASHGFTNHRLATHNQAEDSATAGVQDKDVMVDDNSVYTGKLFSVVYADPPWGIDTQRGSKGADRHYSLMSIERIKGMPIKSITTPSSVCFLWLSNGIFQEGIDVLRAWGYRPTSDFIWIKPRIGLGQYFRYASEKMLMGVRGKMPPAIRSQPNWGFFPLQEHSHKPEEIYTIIERMYPNESYLELFARRRPPNKDWYIWGNEAPGGSDIYLPDYPVPSYSDRATVTNDRNDSQTEKEDDA